MSNRAHILDQLREGGRYVTVMENEEEEAFSRMPLAKERKF